MSASRHRFCGFAAVILMAMVLMCGKAVPFLLGPALRVPKVPHGGQLSAASGLSKTLQAPEAAESFAAAPAMMVVGIAGISAISAVAQRRREDRAACTVVVCHAKKRKGQQEKETNKVAAQGGESEDQMMVSLIGRAEEEDLAEDAEAQEIEEEMETQQEPIQSFSEAAAAPRHFASTKDLVAGSNSALRSARNETIQAASAPTPTTSGGTGGTALSRSPDTPAKFSQGLELPEGVRLRPEDIEVVSNVWHVLPGADGGHMHGLLGRREDGSCCIVQPTALPQKGLSAEERRDAHRGFAFNHRVSDSLPFDRTTQDHRSKQCKDKHQQQYKHEQLPTASVVIVFHNEAFSALMRSVHTVLDHTPPSLLKEILLCDDASTPDPERFYEKHWERLQQELTDYVRILPKIRLIRLKARRGLMLARMEGAWRARGEVVVFLDSHIEATKGWLEPLLDRIRQDKKTVVVPAIDGIGNENFQYMAGGGLAILGFTWTLGQLPMSPKAGSEPQSSPVMAGGLFAGDKGEFLRLGGYDPEMRLYGGEEMEIGFRTWMCGGRIEYIPCSHVGHIFRTASHWRGQVYRVPGDEIIRNKLRAAEVWMDEYKVLMKFATGVLPQGMGLGDLTDRQELRKRLGCKSFAWYIDNVYPQFRVPKALHHKPAQHAGSLENEKLKACVDTLGHKNHKDGVGVYPCHYQHGSQAMVMASNGLVFIAITDYSLCLANPEKDKLRMMHCDDRNSSRMVWLFEKESGRMVLRSEPDLCLTALEKQTKKSPFDLRLHRCGDQPLQKWKWAA